MSECIFYKKGNDVCIENLPFYNRTVIYLIANKNNGKVYVGFSKYYRDRVKNHAMTAKRGNHNSRDFQLDFDRGHVFSVEVLEYYNEEAPLFVDSPFMTREIYHTLKHEACNPLKGYNKLIGTKKKKIGG